MQPVSLTVKPTVDTQGTPAQVGQGMVTSNLIRIKNGYIQKLGGCTRAISNVPFTDRATYVFPWTANNGADQYIAIGTLAELQVLNSATMTTITPMAGAGQGFWTLDKWGDDLIAAIRFNTIYKWTPPVSGGNIAQPLLNAPTSVNGIVVAAPAMQIIAWGCDGDPLKIRYCDVDNNTDWTATAINQAGAQTLTSGSEIMQIIWYGLSGLIWTDMDFWSMTYSGFPLIYGFNKIAPNCGLIGRRAAGQLGTRVAWMSQNDFFQYIGGQVQLLDCTVRDFVFNNIDRSFAAISVHCDTNTFYGEFMWRFPTTGSNGVCNAYVKWTPTENNAWDYGLGQPEISAWADQSQHHPPFGADYNGHILFFETSDDYDGAALNSSFLTGWFYLAEGQEFIFLERIMPDIVLNAGGAVRMTIMVADEIPPDDTDYPVRTYGPFAIDRSTPYFIPRCRGRVARILFECVAAETSWRYGKPLATVCIDGRQ